MSMKNVVAILAAGLLVLTAYPATGAESGISAAEKDRAPQVEKKTDGVGQKVGAAGEKAAAKLDEKAITLKAKMEAAAKYGHEKARQRIAWLKKKAEKLQAEAGRLEARMEAQIKKERERIERKYFPSQTQKETPKNEGNGPVKNP
jgi:hypothetical protein